MAKNIGAAVEAETEAEAEASTEIPSECRRFLSPIPSLSLFLSDLSAVVAVSRKIRVKKVLQITREPVFKRGSFDRTEMGQ